MYLAEIFTDHMVLQRDKDICVFGYGKGSGEIEFCGKTYTFTSTTEKFYVYLAPQSVGGPYEMMVTLNGSTRVIKDILIGDVYIAAGQSNMELPLCATHNIEYFENENIRFFTEPHTADEDGNLLYKPTEWFLCDKSVGDFSAIGYYFAVGLQKSTNVPIGVICCSKGASRVDAWTASQYVQHEDYQKMQSVKHNDYYVYKFNHDSWLYNNKLLSIVPFANSGVLWYQGESNRCHDEGVHYAKLLEIMIKNWRELWQCNLPFYCVQLMPYDEAPDVADWAVIRSQQQLAAQTVDNVYLVTLVNTGEKNEIHPTKKKDIAYALSNAVRAVQHNESVEYSGPVLQTYKHIKNGVELVFSHAEGLHLKGNELQDTYVYDEEDRLLQVDFLLEKSSLIIICKCGVAPKTITMGYNNAPEHNLYNNSGYLASPFKLMLN
ncbi:MAG: hypothetical protein IJN56_08665 [Clostridia bacterium]|nr:hypothetical protein [Clostridia bacterium]